MAERVTRYTGDAFEVLRRLPPKHFDLVLTSPPSWPSPHQGENALGTEPSVIGYVSRLQSVLRSCRRTLKTRGILCLIIQPNSQENVMVPLADALASIAFRVLATYHWSHGDGRASWVVFLAASERARLNRDAEAWASQEWGFPWPDLDRNYGFYEFPDALVEAVLDLALPRGGIILDPFIGKGAALSRLPEKYVVYGIDSLEIGTLGKGAGKDGLAMEDASSGSGRANREVA